VRITEQGRIPYRKRNGISVIGIHRFQWYPIDFFMSEEWQNDTFMAEE
jgi:hypothetical protein